MNHIREKLLKKAVSETTAQLITNIRRKRSQSNYNSSWRMWASCCDKEQVDAFRCDVIKILFSYLRKVMNTGLLDVITQLFLPSMIM